MTTMKNDFISQQSARTAPGPKPAKKLYSIAALLHGKDFAGKFETATATYEFTFAPTAATLNQGKLELTGDFSIHSGRGSKREAKNVRAILLSIQGGLGNVPQPIRARARANSAKPSLPLTEATDASGFVGVMYFRLTPIHARALGLTIDLSSVQLNARLFADNEVERELQVIYADLIAATIGDRADATAAAKNLASLNQLLSRR